MNLIVDIGNTRTKYAVFEDGDWVECGMGLLETYDLATRYLKNGHEVNLILSSTGVISEEVRKDCVRFRLFFASYLPGFPCRSGSAMILRRPWGVTGLQVVWEEWFFSQERNC